MKSLIIFSFSLMLFSSCSVLQKTAREELSDGYYIQKTKEKKATVYVDVVEENIRICPTQMNHSKEIDTTQACGIYFSELTTKEKINFSLLRKSFDVDFLTIPLKLRLSQANVPSQMNTNLNGAIYVGFRTDIYNINYQSTPLKKAMRNTTHFGYSLGLFTGIGNTFMSPTNTNFILDQEYDGIIWSKGFAAIVGINNFTVGLSFGFDQLLDKNNNIWIYKNKPWFGLAFGLNLN